MRLIIAGSRNFCDQIVVFAVIDRALDLWFPPPALRTISEVVSGRCSTGVDPIGERWAEHNNIPVRPFPANWDKHGNVAGPIRNGQMAAYAAAGEAGGALVAIWHRRSPGTGGMIRRAQAAGLLVHVKEVR